MTKILFVLNSTHGGAALSATDLMEGLTARGHRCYAVVPPSAANDYSNLRRVARGVAEIRLPWWNKKYRSALYKRPVHWALGMARSGFRTASTRAIVDVIRRWDIDLVHSNTSLNLEGALAARVTGVAHVWHIREQIGDQQLFRWWLPEPILARAFDGLSDALIVNSETSRAFFARNGFGARAAVVYNGVKMETFDDAAVGRDAVRSRWGVGASETLVGMVANLTSTGKRHDVFVRACAAVAGRHDRCRFVVVGADPDATGGYPSEIAYARGLKALAGELGVADRFTWAGHRSDIPAVMSALDVMVHPMPDESFGRVAVEAMAAGRPLVGADAGGLTEIIEDGATGYRVAVGDPEAFASAVLQVANDQDLARRLGEAGRRRAAERFSLDRTIEDVCRIHGRVLG